jgi:hypothetical protein
MRKSLTVASRRIMGQNQHCRTALKAQAGSPTLQVVTPDLIRGPPSSAAFEEVGGCRIKSGMTDAG